jgi:hypothetical protein
LQMVSLFYFIYVHKVHQPYSPSFFPSIHPPHSHKSPSPQRTFLQSHPSFLIPKSV